MTFPSCGHETLAKSYIDCWPIYARHVVCVKFPFVMLPQSRIRMLQHPLSLCLIIFSRIHTHTHTRNHTATLSPLGTSLISSHSIAHLLAAALRLADWLRSRYSLLLWPRPASAASWRCGLLGFLVRVTCAKLSPDCAQISPARVGMQPGCDSPWKCVCVPLFGCCTLPCPAV